MLESRIAKECIRVMQELHLIEEFLRESKEESRTILWKRRGEGSQKGQQRIYYKIY